MPILVETNFATEFAVSPYRRVSCGRATNFERSCFSSDKKATAVRAKTSPQVSPAKRRLNFDDPVAGGPTFKTPFPHPAATTTTTDAKFPTSAFNNNEDEKSPRVFVDEELDRVAKERAERWNFDFVRGVPLPGRYQWEPVFDRDDDDDDEFRRRGFASDDDAMSGTFVISAPKVSPSSPGRLTKSAVKQLLITDVFRCRKRRSSALSPSSAVDLLPLAENKAPRNKRARLSVALF